MTVENGLFFSVIWGTCTSEEVDGRALYLGIQVGADPEMRPLQALYAVPYAYSLRPGAIINATLSGDAVVHIENSGTTGRVSPRMQYGADRRELWRRWRFSFS